MNSDLNNTHSRVLIMQNFNVNESSAKIMMPEVEKNLESKKSCLCRRVVSFCSMCGSQWLFASKYSLERTDSPLWCNSDICGSICVVFTWLLIAYPCVVLLIVVFVTVDSTLFCVINAPVFYSLALMATLCHLKAVFTDPGTIPLNNATHEHIQRCLEQGVTVVKCTKCESIKPLRTHHCSICQRCVRKMDHHCPWINNCVGENNQKYFIMFTFYIFLMSAFALYICVHFFILCVKDEWSDFLNQRDVMKLNWYRFSPITKSVILISVGFESMVFGMFTLIMFFTQLCGICYDQTGIESLKKESPGWEKHSCMMNLSITFGTPFSWTWFCPINVSGVFNRKYNSELHTV